MKSKQITTHIVRNKSKWCKNTFFTVNLSSDSDDKLKIYKENFEKAYLEAAENFYKQNAPTYLELNGVQNYMRYADLKLKEEEARARRYLETGYGSKSDESVCILIGIIYGYWRKSKSQGFF